MSLQIKLKKLAKELSKLLKDSNLETADKDVLENSQEELQKQFCSWQMKKALSILKQS